MKTIDNLETDITYFLGKINDRLVEIQKETANNIMNDAKMLAPTGKTGEYRESIKISNTKVTENSIETDIYTDVTVSSLDGVKYNLGYLLENGTEPHTILPKNSDVLVFEKDGETIFAKKVNHPGFKPMPHFIPALNKNKFKYKLNIAKTLFKR